GIWSRPTSVPAKTKGTCGARSASGFPARCSPRCSSSTSRPTTRRATRMASRTYPIPRRPTPARSRALALESGFEDDQTRAEAASSALVATRAHDVFEELPAIQPERGAFGDPATCHPGVEERANDARLAEI